MTPIPAVGSPMPKSPKPSSPLSLPPPNPSPRDWSSGESRTPDTAIHFSRCGGITRSPPTAALPTTTADVTHRAHAIMKTVFSDLIDGPLAHAVGIVRRELRLGAVRGDRAQPTARGRPWPAAGTRKVAGGRYGARSSTLPAPCGHNAAPRIICHESGPGCRHGLNYGATSLDSVRTPRPDTYKPATSPRSGQP